MRVKIAKGFFERMIGLLGKKSMSKDEVLVIENCKSVHTFFMRFPIDIVFIDRDSKVVNIFQNVKPFRLIFGRDGAYSVLESGVGYVDANEVSIGQKIEL